MLKKITFIVLLLLGAALPQSAKVTQEYAENFVRCLINKPDTLQFYVLPQELLASERLGITYKSVKNKFLISNEIDYALKYKAAEGVIKYHVAVADLGENYSKVTISFDGVSNQYDYYFVDKYLISPVYYYSRSWKSMESRYFKFIISKPEYFNKYSADKLDYFVDSISKILDYNHELKQRLAENKINYYLCADEDEIKNLTGFNTLGMYYLPFDYIISTYNCHYHELLHLLMNYKIQRNSLFTHPFFQEGFAVALGGRGGKESRVILEMGAFLQLDKMMSYDELLSREQFLANDASMTYPVSGLYNLFLLKKLSIQEYLSLYLMYSGSNNEISGMKINSNDLPSLSEWIRFIDSYRKNAEISFPKKQIDAPLPNKGYDITSIGNDYLVRLKDTLLIKGKDIISGYKSKIFRELFPGREYKGEKYAIIANGEEISVYNFYTNILSAKYVRTFTPAQKTVPEKDGVYFFLIKKAIFDEEIHKIMIAE